MNRIRTTILAAITGAALTAGGAGVAGAQQEQSPQPQGQQQAAVSQQAKQAMSTLHQTNQKEIMLSEMALKKASSPEVREYAQMIVQDHQQNEKQLTSMARTLGVELQTQPDPAQMKKNQQTMQKLQGAEGQQFDQMYVQTMIDGHLEAIQKLSKAQGQIDNQQIAQLMSATLPVLQKHHDRGKELQKKMGSR